MTPAARRAGEGEGDGGMKKADFSILRSPIADVVVCRIDYAGVEVLFGLDIETAKRCADDLYIAIGKTPQERATRRARRAKARGTG